MKKKSVKKGFTLIELIVVIAILGILAAVLLPKFSGFTDDARKKSAMSEAKNVYTAMSAYYAEKGVYPTETDKATTLSNLSDKLRTNTTIASTVPTDGSGLLFTYKFSDKITIKVTENGTLKDS
ncbi:type II secretion system protein G [Hathewaya proteolytica DSM 3090]|uniref:Type II secretion system protein G n=2 Tax=Hathewaya proteolytica TaxID=29365 RepID=A0A1M6LHQ4_9CLOT|nr:type II secretion system protein G [Hathewaya proteolytica DSM 3090]